MPKDKQDKKIRIILAGFVFAVSFLTYLITMAPTVSFWDCGEFIACAKILGIPHPPGTPFFMILAKAVIDVLPFGDVAIRVNFISVVTSALTVMVAFLFTEKLLSLIFSGKASRFVIYCGSLVAAFLLTFSDTFWFSAVEAEVYGAAMFVVMTISWLSLLWVESRDTAMGPRYLILICYLAFLGVGMHLYTMMTIPAIFVLMLMLDKQARYNFPLIITGIVLLSVIFDIGDFIWYGLAMLGICLVMLMVNSNPVWRKRWNLSMWFCIVALVGFSTHAYIPIRSHLDPRIDENDPETWAKFQAFLERKQYGSESMIRRAFHRRGQPLNQMLTYPHMGYGGYMLAQYFPWKVGELRGDENDPVRRGELKFPTQMSFMGKNKVLQLMLFILFQLPLFYGAYFAYKWNKPLGTYIFLLYFISSFGLIFYMNFSDGTRMELREYSYWQSTGKDPSLRPDPVHLEVRDRDYFYTPAFIFMSVLFGVAAGLLLQRLSEKKGGAHPFPRGVGISLVVMAMVVPSFSNFKEHNRGGMYVPYDYAFNLLQSCRPNSILFTNGDNDTFPLWFMQEVENIRMDVKVVNLSLVNTDWYIHQLRQHEPKLVLGFTPAEIDALQPEPWRFKEAVTWKVPNTGLSVELQPRSYLKVQDIMVLHIVQNNFPKRPIHFAVTVSDDNMMGLEKFLEMEGMVYTLTEEKKNKDVNVARTSHLVDSVYRFRGLGDNTTYIDLNTEGLLTNYSATNFRLVMWAQERVSALDQEVAALKKTMETSQVDAALQDKSVELDNKEGERKKMIAFGEKYLQLNERLLPREWRNHYYSAQFYSFLKDYAKAEDYLRQGLENAPNPKLFSLNLAQLYNEQGKYAQAETLLSKLKDEAPGDFELWYGLSEVYRKQNKHKEARDVLARWLKLNPSHQYSSMVAQQLQHMEVPNLNSSTLPSTPTGTDSTGKPGDSAVQDNPITDTGAAKPQPKLQG